MNYRMNLNDAALVKDKHVAAAGGVVEAFALVRHYVHEVPIEIEVDSIAQLRVAITAGADFLLLDNFAVDELRRAVDVVRDHERVTGHPVLVEASRAPRWRAPARRGDGRTGLAVGALTHSSPVLDIGLDFWNPDARRATRSTDQTP